MQIASDRPSDLARAPLTIRRVDAIPVALPLTKPVTVPLMTNGPVEVPEPEPDPDPEPVLPVVPEQEKKFVWSTHFARPRACSHKSSMA